MKSAILNQLLADRPETIRNSFICFLSGFLMMFLFFNIYQNAADWQIFFVVMLSFALFFYYSLFRGMGKAKIGMSILLGVLGTTQIIYMVENAPKSIVSLMLGLTSILLLFISIVLLVAAHDATTWFIDCKLTRKGKLPPDYKLQREMAAQQELVEIPNDPTNFFYIPLKKLALFSIISLGLYILYWFYKNWTIINEKEKTKINPILRTLFSVFFCYDLFAKITREAKGLRYKVFFSPGILAAIYILWTITANSLNHFSSFSSLSSLSSLILATLGFWMGIFSFILIIPLQILINAIHIKTFNGSTEMRLTWKGKTLFTFSTLFLIIFVLGFIRIFASLKLK
jgi:hypothetical protein